MTGPDTYADYLKSDAWKTLRAAARRRAGDKCEMCAGPPNHVHHVKYPKRFKDDHIDNLVVVCEACHRKSHGIRGADMKINLSNPSQHEFVGKGRYMVKAYPVEGGGMVAFCLEHVRQVILGEEAAHNNAYRSVAGSGFETRVMSILDEDEYVKLPDADGRIQTFVLEPGLYHLLVSLDTDPCKRFRRWITHDVLPAIRKTGGYQANSTVVSSPTRAMILQIQQQTQVLLEHQDRIDDLDRRQASTDERVAEVETTVRRWNEIQESGLISAADYVAQNGITDISESELGRLAARYAKENGAHKTTEGWRGANGKIVSNIYPAPGTRFSTLNKWNKKVLDWVVARIRQQQEEF